MRNRLLIRPMPERKLNAAWHHAHPMPPKATLEQRVAWHLGHQQHCGCREIPPGIRAAIDAYEDAGMQGLCEEGRWEAAAGAVRRTSARRGDPPASS